MLQHQKTGKYALFDPQKGFLLPARYDLLTQVGNGLVFFQHDSAGYLDGRGRLRLLTPGCQVLSAYHEGFAVCGKLVPNASRRDYPSAQIIYSTEKYPLAAQYAYMDATGKLISDYFDWVGPFRDGYARVLKNDEHYMIDTHGRRAVLPGGDTLISYFNHGLALVQQGALVGLADKTGRVVLPPTFRSIKTERSYSGDSQLASFANKGNTLLPCTAPKLTNGSVTVTDADGHERQVAVPATK